MIESTSQWLTQEVTIRMTTRNWLNLIICQVKNTNTDHKSHDRNGWRLQWKLTPFETLHMRNMMSINKHAFNATNPYHHSETHALLESLLYSNIRSTFVRNVKVHVDNCNALNTCNSEKLSVILNNWDTFVFVKLVWNTEVIF